MSLTKFFMVAALAFAGFCSSAEAQTANIDFSINSQIGMLFDFATPVGTPVTAPVAGIPGLTITALASASDSSAVLNASPLGLGVNFPGLDDVDGVELGSISSFSPLTFSLDESIAFTFNQNVEISGIALGDIDQVLSEEIIFAGQSITGAALGPALDFNFATPLNIAAGTPVVFSELSGDGATITGLTVSVPEPSSLAMLGFGSVLLTGRRRRR